MTSLPEMVNSTLYIADIVPNIPIGLKDGNLLKGLLFGGH